jgi:hypothetical protein
LSKAAARPEWAKQKGLTQKAGDGPESPFRIVGAS